MPDFIKLFVCTVLLYLSVFGETTSELLRLQAATLPVSHDILSAPPPTPIRNIAEFEPMEGVLIRYLLGIMPDLVKEMAEDVMVYCVVSTSQQDNAENTFGNAGVNMDNVTFINCPSDEYWTRDYGPWWIVNGNEDITFIDFQYNCTWWPLDNEVNGYIKDFLNVDMYYMPISTAGGNYMTDGMGIAASSHRIWRDNDNYTQQQVYDYFEEYLGIEKYHVLDDPNANDIDLDHIDCWAKFLSIDKILIREVPQNNQDYNDVEEVVDYFEDQTSAFGTPYRIYRVYTPNGEPYTNSLILNNKVLVPKTGSQYDDDALQSYQEAMPGYEVLGFTNSEHPWKTYDALHCRAKGIPDMGMLYISHIPLHDTVQDTGDGFLVEAVIKPYSDEALIEDSTVIFFLVDNQKQFQSVTFEFVSGDTFQATIPTQYKNATVSYYLHAQDASGRSEGYPYIGASDPYTFYGEYIGTGITISEVCKNSSIVCKNYPNPFVKKTTISYNLISLHDNTKLVIYSNNGQVIREWSINKIKSSIVWDGTDYNRINVSTGVYYYILRSGNLVTRGKIYLIR